MHQPGLYRDALRCEVVGAMSEIIWASASTRTRSTDRFDRRRDRTLAEAIRIRRAQLLRGSSIACGGPLARRMYRSEGLGRAPDGM